MKDSLKYLKKVKKLFGIYGSEERKYFKDLSLKVDDYTAENPNAVFADYVDNFGEPKEILVLYYQYTDTDLLAKRISLRKYLNIFLIIILIFFIILSALLFKEHIEAKNSYIDREEVIIQEN